MTPSKQALAWIRRGVFILCLMPLARLIWLGFSEQLGANPVEFIEHSTGTWALVALLLSLVITPLRLLFNLGWLVLFRRMLGLFMFFYASLHFLTYLWLDHWFEWRDILIDIAEHPYVLVGFLALMLSIPLAITSTDAMKRRLKQRWSSLHRLTYAIAILAVLHYLWLVKKDVSTPLIYISILVTLFLIRIYFKLQTRK